MKGNKMWECEKRRKRNAGSGMDGSEMREHKRGGNEMQGFEMGGNEMGEREGGGR